MTVADIYRKCVPINIRYVIANIRKSGTEKKLLKDIKNGRFKDDFPNECEYIINHNEVVTFPYSFHDEYIDKNVDIHTDETCKMLYILHDGKRLYFPKGWSKTFVKKYYLSLVEEQDYRSPHRYFPENDSFLDGCVLFDVGAAEGIISLSIIERVRKTILFEADPMWVEALNKTFEPFKEKVDVISCYCSDNNLNGNITIDEIYRNLTSADCGNPDDVFVVKADVEGMEMNVLRGATKLLGNKHSNFLICTYHNPDDEKVIGEYLSNYKNAGSDISKSNGYMLYGIDSGNPSFRKGLVRLIRR